MENQSVNEYAIKISMSKINIPNSLKLGDEVTIQLTGDVTKIEQLDQQDGTYDEVYTVKGIFADATSTTGTV